MIRLLAVLLFGVIVGVLVSMVVLYWLISSKCRSEEELKEWERKLP